MISSDVCGVTAANKSHSSASAASSVTFRSPLIVAGTADLTGSDELTPLRATVARARAAAPMMDAGRFSRQGVIEGTKVLRIGLKMRW